MTLLYLIVMCYSNQFISTCSYQHYRFHFTWVGPCCVCQGSSRGHASGAHAQTKRKHSSILEEHCHCCYSRPDRHIKKQDREHKMKKKILSHILLVSLFSPTGCFDFQYVVQMCRFSLFILNPLWLFCTEDEDGKSSSNLNFTGVKCRSLQAHFVQPNPQTLNPIRIPKFAKIPNMSHYIWGITCTKFSKFTTGCNGAAIKNMTCLVYVTAVKCSKKAQLVICDAVIQSVKILTI